MLRYMTKTVYLASKRLFEEEKKNSCKKNKILTQQFMFISHQRDFLRKKKQKFMPIFFRYSYTAMR